MSSKRTTPIHQHNAVTIIVPTRNEAGNVAPLVDRIKLALSGRPTTILFVDDSTDESTIEAIRKAQTLNVPGFCVEFLRGRGEGLSSAVIQGMESASTQWVVVMDGDLQHPPETIPAMIELLKSGMNLVIASRYCPGGNSDGLDGFMRHVVSTGSNLVSKILFPKALHRLKDLTTGFFAVDMAKMNLGILQPLGYKILLEILIRHYSHEKPLEVAEVPLKFAERESGTSKSELTVGLQFIRQLFNLRFKNSAHD